MALTEEQVIKYVEQGGTYCPHCDSVDLEYGWFNDFSEGAECPVTCKKCGQKWYDVYYLVLMEIGEESVA